MNRHEEITDENAMRLLKESLIRIALFWPRVLLNLPLLMRFSHRLFVWGIYPPFDTELFESSPVLRDDWHDIQEKIFGVKDK